VCEAIFFSLSAEAVNAEIATLDSHGQMIGKVGTSVYHPETHWHQNHIGDRRVGKFKTFLTPDQIEAITENTAEFCETFGYGEAHRTMDSSGSQRSRRPPGLAPG
jgi:hypothetical protein